MDTYGPFSVMETQWLVERNLLPAIPWDELPLMDQQLLVWKVQDRHA